MNRKLNLKWVSDVVKQDYMKWKKGDLIKFICQMGTGKTYFIKKVLAGYAKSRNENILLLCNRIDLKRQLKIDLLKANNIEIPVFENEDGEWLIDNDKLDEIDEISNVTIKSYQKFDSELLDKEYHERNIKLEYDYYVCDEIHWIFSDASFTSTRVVAEYLFSTLTERITILMSATMSEVELYLDELNLDSNIINYTTGEDYSYLDVKYFKNELDIINTINNDKTDSKWVVFVSDIGKGKEFKEVIPNSELVYSGAKCKERDNVVANGEFNCKCLITTKVMDNGINFTDKKLTNMVIYGWDEVTFKQEVGRKRIDISKEPPRVNLYIYTRFQKSFTSKIHGIEETKVKALELYNTDYTHFNRVYDTKLNTIESSIFYKHNGEYEVNDMGVRRMKLDLEFFKYMEEKFDYEGEFAFVKEQLSWIGLEDTFSEYNLIEDVVLDINKSELDKFLKTSYSREEYFTKEVFIDKFADFIDSDENMTFILNDIDGGNGRTKGIKLINKFLLDNRIDIPYVVCSQKKSINGIRKNYWFVKRSA